MTKNKYTTISIPIQLADKIDKIIENTGFNSVSSYTIYVLRQTITNKNEEEKNSEKTNDESKEAFSKSNEEKVKERLRALGYI